MTDIYGTVFLHKGVDLSYPTGTNVYAVADGKVVDLHEEYRDNSHDTTWGNYVVIQHPYGKRHWDSTNGALAYVYSIYLHLSQFTVVPEIGSNVAAGALIAESDNTGNSSGPHLHYQVVLHPQADRELDPFTLDSENRSRNPELWLTPLSNKGTAVGKITDVNGNPVGNLRVCGIQKSYGGYGSSRTYSYPWANPDDLLHENFGTTDVSPGTYHLYAYNYVDETACGSTPLYRDLGNHTFAAGKVTYVGL